MSPDFRCIAFEGHDRIAAGELPLVVRKTKAVLDRGERAPVLIFDLRSSQLVEIDFRGTLKQVLERLPQRVAAKTEPPPGEASAENEALARKPGRPRLGVVAREVTLLPRHWEWLNAQPGGASVALRKLVDEARQTKRGTNRRRQAQESAYRFMHALAGNLPGFEEASRALFAANSAGFSAETESWPPDVREHARQLAAECFY